MSNPTEDAPEANSPTYGELRQGLRSICLYGPMQEGPFVSEGCIKCGAEWGVGNEEQHINHCAARP